MCIQRDKNCGEITYYKYGKAGFGSPRSACDFYGFQGNKRVKLEISCELSSDKIAAKIFVIFYKDVRAHTKTFDLNHGLNKFEFDLNEDLAGFRPAIRIVGDGKIILGNPSIKINERPKLRHDLYVDDESSSFREFKGNKLMFIFSPPRSGSTWLLHMLSHLDGFVHANVDNLDIRINDRLTDETNIFNPNRCLSDNAIKSKFYELQKQNPNCFIVEKTPIHLLEYQRIHNIFPNAIFIGLTRNVFDTVSSLMQVRKDSNTWWRGAPKNIKESSSLWIKYALAYRQLTSCFTVKEISYEEMHSDPSQAILNLLKSLNIERTIEEIHLSTLHSKNGSNYSVPSSFKGGGVGKHKINLTEEDMIYLEKEMTSSGLQIP